MLTTPCQTRGMPLHRGTCGGFMLLLQIMALWPLALVTVLAVVLAVVARVLKVFESRGLNIADNVCEIERSVG